MTASEVNLLFCHHKAEPFAAWFFPVPFRRKVENSYFSPGQVGMIEKSNLGSRLAGNTGREERNRVHLESGESNADVAARTWPLSITQRFAYVL
jgi:hypothetical protein